MFGLMKARVCAQPGDLRQQRRLHYCGTCKTMGRLYGQRSRLLLNHDAVFLGEVLSALSGEDRNLEQWNDAYQSYNCLSLPASSDDMPVALQFAAAVAVVSAEFKVADALIDSNSLKWKAANGLFSKAFCEASARLVKWGVPLDLLWQCSRDQQVLEAAALDDSKTESPGAVLDQLAGPTARATAMMFEHGAQVAGCWTAQEALGILGRDFGRIVYLLDAVEDYEKDVKTGSFNAIQAAFDLSTGKLPVETRTRMKLEISALAEQVEVTLNDLPIPPGRAAQFSARLKANLSRRLGIELPIATHVCEHQSAVEAKTSDRWIAAVKLARSISLTRFSSDGSAILALLKTPFVFLSVFVIALVFPSQTRSAKTYRECVDVAFNLMILGSVLKPSFIGSNHLSSAPPGGPGSSPGPGSVFPPGYSPPPGSAGGPGQPSGHPSGEPTGKKTGGNCGVCCCDCGDCDCCCDCGECCGSCDC